jgi:hypothetical protein
MWAERVVVEEMSGKRTGRAREAGQIERGRKRGWEVERWTSYIEMHVQSTEGFIRMWHVSAGALASSPQSRGRVGCDWVWTAGYALTGKDDIKRRESIYVQEQNTYRFAYATFSV